MNLNAIRFTVSEMYLPTGDAALNARSSDSSVLFIDADCTRTIKIVHIISKMSIVDLLIFIDIIVVNLCNFFPAFKNRTTAASV